MTTDRRPVSARNWGMMSKFASKLAKANVSPNSISQASVIMAALGAVCFFFGLHNATPNLWLLILGIGFNQLRLICNLLDGMVAVEHNQQGKDGAFWNEVPDRISDTITFFGVGLAIGWPALGLSVAVLAVFAAYLRAFGVSLGFEADFSGPADKQARIHILCLGVLVAIFAQLIFSIPFAHKNIMIFTFLLLIILIAMTAFRRGEKILDQLNQKN